MTHQPPIASECGQHGPEERDPVATACRLFDADLAALAALLDGQGRNAESEPLYLRALAVFEKHYGPDHYEVAVNLNNLAAAYQAQDRRDEADSLYRRALAIKEKLLGADHPDVAMTLNNLAMLCMERGQLDEAEALCRRALAIFTAVLEPQHPKVRTCRDNLDQLLRQQQAQTDDCSGEGGHWYRFTRDAGGVVQLFEIEEQGAN